ncbi:unnamed protein product [Arctogadus glacialis]
MSLWVKNLLSEQRGQTRSDSACQNTDDLLTLSEEPPPDQREHPGFSQHAVHRRNVCAMATVGMGLLVSY